MHRFARVLPFVLVLASVSSADAQVWSLLAGPGGVDHQGGLGLAYHVNLRHELLGWTDVRVDPSAEDPWIVPAVRLEGELFAQRGGSGTRVTTCSSGEGMCTGSADPLHVLGAGLVSKIELTRAGRLLQVYYLPLTAAPYLRWGDFRESPVGEGQVSRTAELKLAGGFGNGGGIQLRRGQFTALLEVRAILIRDLDGARGGALPISLGIRW